jgi:hypothetical protein
MGAGMGRDMDGTSVSGGSGGNGCIDGADDAFSSHGDGDSGPDRPRLQDSRLSTAHETPSIDARRDGEAGASGAEKRFERPGCAMLSGAGSDGEATAPRPARAGAPSARQMRVSDWTRGSGCAFRRRRLSVGKGAAVAREAGGGARGGTAGVRNGTGSGVSTAESGALAREARSMSALGDEWGGVRAADRIAECWRCLTERGLV